MNFTLLNDFNPQTSEEMYIQHSVWMEECSELIKEISKKLRYPATNNYYITEEIADVIICINQMCDIYNIKDKDIQKVIEYKQLRNIERNKARNLKRRLRKEKY